MKKSKKRSADKTVKFKRFIFYLKKREYKALHDCDDCVFNGYIRRHHGGNYRCMCPEVCFDIFNDGELLRLFRLVGCEKVEDKECDKN